MSFMAGIIYLIIRLCVEKAQEKSAAEYAARMICKGGAK